MQSRDMPSFDDDGDWRHYAKATLLVSHPKMVVLGHSCWKREAFERVVMFGLAKSVLES